MTVRARPQLGYTGLLNVDAQPHWTVFLTDFALPDRQVAQIRAQLDLVSTRPLFVRTEQGIASVMRQIRAAGADVNNDYVSFHALVRNPQTVSLLTDAFARLARRDMAKIDVPRGRYFRHAFAKHLLDAVLRSDYAEQSAIAATFFGLLGRRTPYRVRVHTDGGVLEVSDTHRWFRLAGRLREGEMRALPDGEVAYTGKRAEGEFVVDGALLPVPQHQKFAPRAMRLMKLSRELARQPLRLVIRAGRVVDALGSGRAARELQKLFDRNDRYREVTEVGISFNRSCTRFVHDWPAASNEVRPGVHIGLGGEGTADGESPKRAPLVHIDCMAANCEVWVNGQPFLRASS